MKAHTPQIFHARHDFPRSFTRQAFLEHLPAGEASTGAKQQPRLSGACTLVAADRKRGWSWPAGAPWAVRESGALEQAPQGGAPARSCLGWGHIPAEKSEGQRP